MRVRALTRAEVRGIDAQAEALGLPTIALMENAGRGAADWLRKRLGEPANLRVVIACGPGNNGGDGGVVARHLDAAGFDVLVAWCADAARLLGDAAIQRDVLAHSGIRSIIVTQENLDSLWTGAAWVVDALLGTGVTRPVEGLLAAAIRSINQSRRPVLALDLPSGLDADTGQPQGVAIQATATATFVAPKVGFEAPGASEYLGEVIALEIGVPRRILAPYLVD